MGLRFAGSAADSDLLLKTEKASEPELQQTQGARNEKRRLQRAPSDGRSGRSPLTGPQTPKLGGFLQLPAAVGQELCGVQMQGSSALQGLGHV